MDGSALFILGPTFTSRRGSLAQSSTYTQHASSSTSLSQRFRRAILKNDLQQAKGVALKAIALAASAAIEPEAEPRSAPNYESLQGLGRATAHLLELSVRRGSAHTVRGAPNSPPDDTPQIDARIHRPSPLQKSYMPAREVKPAYPPVRERALLRHRALLERPFDIRNVDPDAEIGSSSSKTSLALAIETGADVELIQWLLDMGHESDEPSRDADSNSIITAAALHNRSDVIELYVSHPTVAGVDLIDWSNNSLGQTALHLASVKGHEDVIRLLLALGAEVDLPDREGNTALHFASAWGHLTVVQLLIERGCAFAVKNTAGFTPADFAYSHSVKAALEAFGRVQHELRRRRWRAASAASGLDHEVSEHVRASSNMSPRMTDESALQDDDDYEEMGGYAYGGSAGTSGRKDSLSDATLSKAERLLGTAFPNTTSAATISGSAAIAANSNSPFFQSQWQPANPSPRSAGQRTGSLTAEAVHALPRPSFSPFPLTPNTRHTEPASPQAQPAREDSFTSTTTLQNSASLASISSNMGSVANKMIMQDQAAMSSYLNKAKTSPTGSKRR